MCDDCTDRAYEYGDERLRRLARAARLVLKGGRHRGPCANGLTRHGCGTCQTVKQQREKQLRDVLRDLGV